MRLSDSKPDLWRQNPPIMTPNGFRQAVSNPGNRIVQLAQCRLRYTDGDGRQNMMDGSLIETSPQPCYRSSIRLEVPPRSTSTVVLLDKLLSFSLEEPVGRGAGQHTQHRSTFSVRLHVSSCQRSAADNKPAKTIQGSRGPRGSMLGFNKRSGQGSRLGQCTGPLSKQWGRRVEQTAPAHSVNRTDDDSDTQHHRTTLGLLSFRGPCPSNTKADKQKGNADEAASPTKSNFKHRLHTFNIGPVESGASGRPARCDKTEEHPGHGCAEEPEHVSDKARYYESQLKANSLKDTSKTLSLKEALELFRPDFISRSQGRVRRLEQRARSRRTLQESNPDLVQGLWEDRGKFKRNCTTPDPLSDNLFKPRERSISGREMQLRSRRIYNKLPEVTKKREEEKRRAVSQTNRLRAEVFKKRLLDQILQR